MTQSVAEDAFILGGRSFRSRLFVGTGKYATFVQMKEVLEKSETEVVTVAVRRVNLDRSKEEPLGDHQIEHFVRTLLQPLKIVG